MPLKAWLAERLGEPEDVMALRDVPSPTPADGEVLLRVRAVSLGFPDVLIVRGEYQTRHELPFSPGSEVCGEVGGERVAAVAVGGTGALAQYLVADPRYVYPAPTSLSDAETAALPAAFMTAWFGLHERGRLQPGETVVVTAAAGGVGSAAVQLGRAAGARVIGITRGSAKTARIRELGAHVVIDSTAEDVVARVREETEGGGADVVFDVVGGDAYHAASRYVGCGGRILVVGFASGEVQSARLNRPLLGGFSIVGVNMSLHLRHEPDAVREAMSAIAKLCDAGTVKPFVGVTVGMADAAHQLQRIGAGLTSGRVAVDPWQVAVDPWRQAAPQLRE
ncbi:NADPH:quinone oxidoreductase family protein [Trebonia sp.]|uniref:NADPH:quinone oxidoreductase family protein n=1 Tax=Trebonia sp. TaxID=2767075 RepID=UPI0026073FED|nr:NADPH:quinone oxidoreductase family protein [Trebonia sp.]